MTLVPLPDRGRRYVATRTVRLGDAGLDGLLRLDALARFLQDVAADDAAEVGLRAATWVVRRTTLVIEGRPSFGERMEVTTFCGGLGSRWAERRTSVVGPTSRIEAASVWVHVDEATGRPAPLPTRFVEAYAEAAGGRTVSSRLSLPEPPGDAARTPWPLRATDFDVLGHVNNSVYWAIVEDEPVLRGIAELEYRSPIGPGVDVALVAASSSGDARERWLVSPEGTHAAARITSTS
ncbi:MAG TPA: acyl-ACP thioesterase domain-containing protein [Acidimicrobiales bacterium]|nr:acyl-ACP thioesterase domain-containing protein [Acidimicrobiales bacterium]